MNLRSILSGTLAAALVLILQSHASAKIIRGIYYSESDEPGSPGDPDAIKRANLDGTQQVTIAYADASLGLDASLATQSVYWTDSRNFGVPSLAARVNFDGTNRQDLVTSNIPFPFGMSIDDKTGKMYWTETHTGELERANLDGSGRELVTQVSTAGGAFLRAVHVDNRNGDVYFGQSQAGLYKLPNGSSTPIQIVNAVTPFGLDIDPVQNRIYWTDVHQDKIQSSRLDGTDVQDFVTGNITLLGDLSLDLASRKLYWADQLGGTINRVNLDGSGREVVIQTPHIPFALEIISVPEPAAMGLFAYSLTCLGFCSRLIQQQVPK